MTVRTTYKSTTLGAITGDVYMDSQAQHVDAFWNAVPLRLTSIGGTADAVTAVVAPILDIGLVAGMAFWFTPTSTNTAAMTMVIGTEAAVAIVSSANAALVAADIVSGTAYPLLFDGTSLRVMAGLGTPTTGADVRVDTFTVSGTLTKPPGFPVDGVGIVEMWGGGGGGNTNAAGGGGGGGAYNIKTLAGVDFAATETVTIGAGGAAGVAGGTTSVGTLIYAYGGGTSTTSTGGGGGGGGQQSAGNNNVTTTGGIGGNPSPGLGALIGAEGLHGNSGGGAGDGNTDGGDGIFGGGGGGGNGGSAGGGNSLYGGAGGGDSSGGTSVFGGDGGATATGGVIPGGGGGNDSGAGARGEVIVRWIG